MVIWFVPLGLGFVGSMLIAEIYKRYTTPEEKQRFEGWVKTHHGEAGFVGILVGLLLKSPGIVGSGVGLVYHDREDISKLFTGDKCRQNIPHRVQRRIIR